MNNRGYLRARLLELVHATRWHLLLRLVVLLAPLLVLVCMRQAAGHLGAGWPVPVVLLAVTALLMPDSAAGVVLLPLLLWEWYATVNDPHSWWVLPAALCVLAFHAACAACSGLPPAARWPARSKRRWLRRTGLVALATIAAWAVGAGIGAVDAPGDAVVTGAAAFAIAAALWWFLRRNPTS